MKLFIFHFQGGVKPKTVSFAGDPTELEPQNPQNGKLATSLILGRGHIPLIHRKGFGVLLFCEACNVWCHLNSFAVPFCYVFKISWGFFFYIKVFIFWGLSTVPPLASTRISFQSRKSQDLRMFQCHRSRYTPTKNVGLKHIIALNEIQSPTPNLIRF